eukprot:gene472-34331_t
MASRSGGSSRNADPFAIPAAGIRVERSATIIIARRRKCIDGELACTTVTAEQLGADRQHGRNTAAQNLLGDERTLGFESNWELCMAQNEVVNWMRSTDKGCDGGGIRTMRYPCEYKFPGGNMEEGESAEVTALRELSEELLVPCGIALPPQDQVQLIPLAVKQTRPIRGRSNLIFNFVLLADENPWLGPLLEDTATINGHLASRRRVFQKVLDSKQFWTMSTAEKESVAPEVREVKWLPLATAFGHMISSMCPAPLIYVNMWQQEMFALHGLKRRDPMFITGATLLELEGFPSEAALLRHAASADTAQLALEEQWLFDGMSQKSVEDAFTARMHDASLNPSFKDPLFIKDLRERRRQADLDAAVAVTCQPSKL